MSLGKEVTTVRVNNDQEALSKQLEFVRQKSRSTFLDRPRAKSEELMVVKQKFPHQMPDAQKKQNQARQRMQSDSSLQTTGTKHTNCHTNYRDLHCNLDISKLVLI